MPAGGALNGGCKATAIEQQNHLAFVAQRLGDGGVQLTADGSAPSTLVFDA